MKALLQHKQTLTFSCSSCLESSSAYSLFPYEWGGWNSSRLNLWPTKSTPPTNDYKALFPLKPHVKHRAWTAQWGLWKTLTVPNPRGEHWVVHLACLFHSVGKEQEHQDLPISSLAALNQQGNIDVIASWKAMCWGSRRADLTCRTSRRYLRMGSTASGSFWVHCKT